MRPLKNCFFLLCCLIAFSSAAHAGDKYHITSEERAACGPDAMRLCMWSYPDEDKLLGCMKQNRTGLSAACRVAFDSGIKRRRL